MSTGQPFGQPRRSWFRGLTRSLSQHLPHVPLQPTKPLPQLFQATMRELPRIRQLKRVLSVTTKLLVRYFGTAHAEIYVEHLATGAQEQAGQPPHRYRLMASHGTQPPRRIPYLDQDSLLLQWLREHRRPLRRSDYRYFFDDSRESNIKQNPYRRVRFVLENLNAHLVMPSFHGKRLLGFLVLGERTEHGNQYTDEEVEAIAGLAQSFAIALENARSYEELKTTTQGFRDAQDRLIRQDRMVAAGKLAMGLAHEIKNPLAAIKTFTEFLPERHTDPEFLKEYCQVITKEVDRISGIVQSLSDFARPVLMKFGVVDVQQPLRETLTLLSNDCLKRGVTVRQMFESGPIFISGDANQLKQIFFNLCVNAIQAMEQGGTLAVSCHCTEHEAIIRILDTGIGIPKEHLAVLFEPFFTTKDGGMGLGLAVVKQIVEQHFGSIKVESCVGEGTAFEIRLPWATKLEGSEATRQETSLTIKKEEAVTPIPIHLLVVDDEPKIRSILKEDFQQRGCHVRTAASGTEALALLDQELAQLVILDLRMEELNGFEILKHLKTRYPELPVIVITGTYEDSATEVKALGALECFIKPLKMPALRRLVFEVAARLSPKAATTTLSLDFLSENGTVP